MAIFDFLRQGANSLFDLFRDNRDIVSAGAGLYDFFNQRDQGRDLQKFASSGLIDPFGQANRESFQGRLQSLYANPTATLENLPGYQFTRDQGEKAIRRQAARTGQAFGGKTFYDLMDYNQGLAAQTYADERNALGRFAGADFPPQSPSALDAFMGGQLLERGGIGSLLAGLGLGAGQNAGTGAGAGAGGGGFDFGGLFDAFFGENAGAAGMSPSQVAKLGEFGVTAADIAKYPDFNWDEILKGNVAKQANASGAIKAVGSGAASLADFGMGASKALPGAGAALGGAAALGPTAFAAGPAAGAAVPGAASMASGLAGTGATGGIGGLGSALTGVALPALFAAAPVAMMLMSKDKWKKGKAASNALKVGQSLNIGGRDVTVEALPGTQGLEWGVGGTGGQEVITFDRTGNASIVPWDQSKSAFQQQARKDAFTNIANVGNNPANYRFVGGMAKEIGN